MRTKITLRPTKPICHLPNTQATLTAYSLVVKLHFAQTFLIGYFILCNVRPPKKRNLTIGFSKSAVVVYESECNLTTLVRADGDGANY